MKKSSVGYKTENIIINNKLAVCLYYKKNKASELLPFKNLPKDYLRLLDIFGVCPKLIKIKLIYIRQEMDNCWGSKSKIVGMTDNKNPYLIYIFSPLVFDKFNKSGINYHRLIVHELAHAFVTEINKRCFAWINEGVCEYACGEKYDKQIKKSDWQWFKDNQILINPNISWREIMNHGGYKISYHLMKYIIKKYGHDAMLDLLAIKRVKNNNLKNKISKLLGGDINKFLKDFEKTINLI